jgi:hypothetical protein
VTSILTTKASACPAAPTPLFTHHIQLGVQLHRQVDHLLHIVLAVESLTTLTPPWFFLLLLLLLPLLLLLWVLLLVLLWLVLLLLLLLWLVLLLLLLLGLLVWRLGGCSLALGVLSFHIIALLLDGAIPTPDGDSHAILTATRGLNN